MKILKAFGFLLLAAIAFVAFVYPFDAVPVHFEKQALEITEERVSGSEVDQSYIDESVNEAMRENLDTVYRVAAIIACAAALAVFLLSMRPPHDCGGLNLFNPFALVLVAAISVLASLTVGLLIKGYGSDKAAELNAVIKSVSDMLQNDELILIVLIPAALEIVFRGVIMSFLEKVHPVAAILLCPVLYAAAIFAIVASYAKYAPVSRTAMYCAVCAAFCMGVVMTLIAWRLRSVIPAVLSHVFIAWSSARVQGFIDGGSIRLLVSAAALVVLLAVFMLLPRLLGKKVRIFAYDFPFEKHHAKMYDWLYGDSKKSRRKKKKASDTDNKGERPLSVPDSKKAK